MSLLTVLGVAPKTYDSIVAPLRKIVVDLEAFIDDKIAEEDAAKWEIVRQEQIQTAAAAANVAATATAEKIKALVGDL